MQKTSITFQPYSIDDRDKIAVYSKIRARHAATGLDYFAALRTSVTLAIHGISDGIGEDMLHAAAVGRLEAEAYMHDVARNMPLTIEAFEVLLVDVGEYNRHGKLTRHCQYSEIQAVIDNDISGGSTGRYSTTEKSEKIARLEAEAEARYKAADAAAKAAEAEAAAKVHYAAADAAAKAAKAAAKAAEAEAAAKAAEISMAITTDMLKKDSALDEALFAILKKWSLVSVCQLYAEGTSWEDIADIIGYSNAAAAKMSYQRAKAKLKKAGIEAFLK